MIQRRRKMNWKNNMQNKMKFYRKSNIKLKLLIMILLRSIKKFNFRKCIIKSNQLEILKWIPNALILVNEQKKYIKVWKNSKQKWLDWNNSKNYLITI